MPLDHPEPTRATACGGSGPVTEPGDDGMQEVAADVFRVTGGLVNWYLLRDGRDLTLVDAGYPGDAAAVLASIAALGHRPGDVAAVLLTHAHADHMGAAPLLATHGVPTWCAAAEVPHARREFLQQVTAGDLLPHLWRPRVLRWALGAVGRGGLRSVAVPQARALPADGPLDLPGAPVPVPTPGHTVGHTAYLVPGAGALLTGDALVTGHPTARWAGPQLLPEFFDHDRPGAERSLGALAGLDAGLLLPGHGEPLRIPVARAVELALARA
jgi:glyoxylase-like metal-dependent hydrolase (beta-lactamase superfamily II)